MHTFQMAPHEIESGDGRRRPDEIITSMTRIIHRRLLKPGAIFFMMPIAAAVIFFSRTACEMLSDIGDTSSPPSMMLASIVSRLLAVASACYSFDLDRL